MMHAQVAQHQEVKQGIQVNSESLMANKTITVNVQNQLGEQQNSYTITGLGCQSIGTKLQKQNQVIQVLVDGVPMTMNQAKKVTFANAGSTITIMENENMDINASYTVNGQVTPIGNTDGDYITQTSAKIYVPGNILSNRQNQLTSVSINDTQYMGKIEGNYVVVNGDIPAISSEANNVVVNFQNNNFHNQPNTVSQGTADIQVVVMNQYGEELSSQELANVNGQALLPIIGGITSPVQSIKYNGNEVTLMNLLTQNYTPGTNNMLVITENTPSPAELTLTMNGHAFSNLPQQDATVTATGATFTLPSGLLRHFAPEYVNINGTEYKGTLNGDKYVINAFIPQAIQYNVQVALGHKNA